MRSLRVLIPLLLGTGLMSTGVLAQQRPQEGTIKGVLIDEWMNSVPNVQISLTTFLRPFELVKRTHTDMSGTFRFDVPAGTYRVGGTFTSANAYLSCQKWKDVVVRSDDTISVVLDAREGHGLVLNDRVLNGQSMKVAARAGETLEVSFTFQIWSSRAVPESDQIVVVGIEGEPLFMEWVGIPGVYPGISDRVRFQTVLPDTMGSLRIYAVEVLYSDRTSEVVPDTYRKNYMIERSKMIRVGTVRIVRD